MKPDLKAMIGNAGSHARRLLIEEGQKELLPFYHIVRGDDEPDIIIACAWRDDREKHQAVAQVKAIAHRVAARAVMFVGEVWMVVMPAQPSSWHAKRALDASPPPSEHPERRECVFALATDGSETKAARWQMIRARPGGPVIALVEDSLDDGSFEGRLLDGLLPRKPA